MGRFAFIAAALCATAFSAPAFAQVKTGPAGCTDIKIYSMWQQDNGNGTYKIVAAVGNHGTKTYKFRLLLNQFSGSPIAFGQRESMEVTAAKDYRSNVEIATFEKSLSYDSNILIRATEVHGCYVAR